MAELRVNVLFAGLATADLATARDWYERLIGRPPDMVPHAGEVAWRLTDGGWIYVLLDPPRAGGGLATVIVGDLDRTLAELAARGIEAGSVETLGSGARKATVIDPDGNRIGLAEVPAA